MTGCLFRFEGRSSTIWVLFFRGRLDAGDSPIRCALFVIVGLLFAAFAAFAAEAADPAGFKTLAIGDRAPDFKLPGVDGKEYSLADIAVIPFIDRINNLRPDLVDAGRLPRLLDWYARMRERPAFAKAIYFNDDPRAAELPNL